ncbi:MAG TPA: hypothetical protein VF147_17375 [Vicinamibacterales bacterium]
MRSMWLALFALTFVAPAVGAQPTPEQARAIAEKSFVTVTVLDGRWKGQLIDIDSETVTIQRPGSPALTLPLTSVVRIDQKKRAHLGEAAAVGAMIAGVHCLRVCGQRVDTPRRLVGAIVAEAMVGAGIGLAIDAAVDTRVTLYEYSAPARPASSPGLSFTLRF